MLPIPNQYKKLACQITPIYNGGICYKNYALSAIHPYFLAIIGTVWYNNHLTVQHNQNVNELNSQLEKLQLTTEPKINNLERKLKETYETLDLEEETFRDKMDALERTAQQNAERSLRRKKAAVQATLVNRELTAKEWEVTLATFKTRRAEIAKLLVKNKQQITINNQKLAEIIKRDTEDIARREDAMRSAARAAMASGRAGGRGTSYAIIEAKEAMEKKHRNMTKAVSLQNKKTHGIHKYYGKRISPDGPRGREIHEIQFPS